MPDARDDVHRAGAAVAARYAPILRQHAIESGWPPDLARRLSVTVSAGSFVPSFDGSTSLPKEVEDLEYGTGSTAPRAALGTFFQSKAVQRDMSAAFRAYLEGLPKKFDNALRGLPV